MLMYRIGGDLPQVPLHILDVHQGRSGKLLLALASTVILCSESCGIHDHILLSHTSGSCETHLVHQGLTGLLYIAPMWTDVCIHICCHRNMFQQTIA
jgi:hypothetical protein